MSKEKSQKKKIRLSLLIIVISFFTALFFFVQSFHHLSIVSNSKIKSFYKGKQGVALTFNIGWGDENAEKILDVLKREECKSATFFLSGEWVERHPHIVDKIIAQHYEIGILGYEYHDYSEMSEKEITRDVSKALHALEKAGVTRISLMRAPTGDFDKNTVKVAEKMSLTLVHWSVNTRDWENPSIKKIIASVAKVNEGDIILLHASDSALQTAEALPQIFAKLKKQNLKLLTISEMIANGQATSKEISSTN